MSRTLQLVSHMRYLTDRESEMISISLDWHQAHLYERFDMAESNGADPPILKSISDDIDLIFILKDSLQEQSVGQNAGMLVMNEGRLGLILEALGCHEDRIQNSSWINEEPCKDETLKVVQELQAKIRSLLLA